jgi:membrane protein YqaA with SNARE-associated domain
MMKNNSRYHRIVEERLLLQLVKSELLRELKREVLERAALMLVQISGVAVLYECLAEFAGWHRIY